MNCPTCKADNGSKVIDSRQYIEWTRRRRECKVCSTKYTTYETICADEGRANGPPKTENDKLVKAKQLTKAWAEVIAEL